MSPITQTAAPALPAELEAMMRQLKMPYARALAPELIATARAQRWEPAEIIRALFVEEITGRSRSMLATRRKAAGFPTGKTFDTWDEAVSSIPAPTQQALSTFGMDRAAGERRGLRPLRDGVFSWPPAGISAGRPRAETIGH